MGDETDATVHGGPVHGDRRDELPTEHSVGAEQGGPVAQQGDPVVAEVATAQIFPLGDEVMRLLAEHVPLALLADLAAPSDGVSAEILRSEGLPEDAWWEDADAAPTGPRPDDAPSPADGPNQTSLPA